ncbi:MAG TPA: BglG family transcription antiterminator [Clostridiales bacterium]|nr:BglG family transcription antiterminator [Clostridiales bacterium]
MKEWESKMLEEKLFEIFKRMSATEYISAERLAKAVGVSEKTIRTRLCMLDDWLQQNQAALISKPRYGYRIITEHYDELYHRLLQEQEGSQGIPDNLQERVQYVLLYLLCQANYVKSEDLIDFLYISKGTLSGVLKQVEQILNNYRLRLDRRPNYGIKIIGREFDIRNCMLEYFVKRSLIDIEQEKQKADIEKIAILVEELLGKHDVHLSEIAYENIVLVLYITLERIKRDHRVESLDGQQYTDKSTQEFLMLEEIIDKMEIDYSVSFAKEEHDYLLLHLMSKQTTKGANQEEASVVISEEVSNLVDGMLEFIRQETMYDFYSDFEVQMLLKQHMVKMDIRLRYHIFLDNPMLEEIKENHSIAYTIATLATTVLKDYYKTAISEEETGYLALIFLLGLERKQNEEKQKLNILIVCVSGKGSSQLLKYKYMHRFHDYIQEVYTCDMLELKEFDLEKINFVFTTVPIPWEISKSVVEIGLFLSVRRGTVPDLP